ncbi:MAG TPA: NYN domain-containing protein [Candidatus Omnitrophota bacterium]|nr:NYN domain-containing protein [Candidatus Omnitrophota bacterium]HPS20996.1 NYN domain-containing protein [Candidatus Omnitrophota bacterium]
MTILVVDGYNAVYAIPELRGKLNKSLMLARKSITELSKKYAKSSGFIDEVRVVFDGDDRYRHMEKLDPDRGKEQIFSASGRGDDKIIETIRICARKNRVVVASNDNYVRNNARAYGASVIEVQELAHAKKNKAPGKGAEKNIDQRVCDEITFEYKKRLGI